MKKAQPISVGRLLLEGVIAFDVWLKPDFLGGIPCPHQLKLGASQEEFYFIGMNLQPFTLINISNPLKYNMISGGERG